ncbi:MAG: LptF/LptG family permease [Candidatus Caenarcaniphilales bacterium]|nr:LptF/LptG family permease [Candidatus Caenarcaniphilales bacterium]
MGRRLDLYILSQFLLPFISATGIVTGVWLGIDRFKVIAKIMSSGKVEWFIGPYIMLLDIPKIILNTLPICVLLACFLAFQKLSSQAEFIAMRAAGASLLRILKPVGIFGLIGLFTCFIVSEFIYPVSEPLSIKLFNKARSKSEKEIKSFTYIKRNEQGDTERILYVKTAQPNQNNYEDLIMVDFDDKKNSSGLEIYSADSASFNQSEKEWNMNMVSYSSMIKKENQDLQHKIANPDSMKIESRINPQKLLASYRDANLLNFMKLFKLIKYHEKENLETSSLNSLKSNFHKRFSYPFTCTILAIIGALLGLSPKRRAINWDYIVLGLIVFMFFMTQAISNSFGDSGRVLAWFSMWLPNIFLILLAFGIYRYKLES